MNEYALVERFYDVPARFGARVRVDGREGQVVGVEGNCLRVTFSVGDLGFVYHPMRLEWLDDHPIKEGA